MKKEIIEIKSVEEFVKMINKNHPDNFVYRGMSRVGYKLIPSIARLEHLHNDPNRDWHTFYKELEQKFQNEYESYSKKEIKNSIELSAIAQHHGRITNLLDWTQNPLVALYFSVSDVKHYDNTTQKDSVVWALSDFKPFYLDPNNPQQEIPITDKQVVIFLRHLSERFKVQKGCFTHHDLPLEMKPFIPMEDVDNASTLIKYVIKGDTKKGIRIQLNTLGVNESMVFPDLDGMCRHLTWKSTNTNYTQNIGLSAGEATH